MERSPPPSTEITIDTSRIQHAIIQLLASAAGLVPYLLLTRQAPSAGLTPAGVLMLVIVGVVHTGVAYVLYFGSMERLQAQTVPSSAIWIPLPP